VIGRHTYIVPADEDARAYTHAERDTAKGASSAQCKIVVVMAGAPLHFAFVFLNWTWKAFPTVLAHV
jgi:hypothetical protein